MIDQDSAILSCGGYGTSQIRSLKGFATKHLTAKILFEAPKDYFLEGCATLPSGNLIVLTWRNHKILEYSLTDSRLVREVYYPHDGWGLAYDTDRNVLIATDGSDKLFYINPSTLEIDRSCSVRLSHNGSSYAAVRYMNELEYMNGLVFANIYIPAGIKGYPNFIVGINLVTCEVDQVIPFNLFAGSPESPDHVMNGIARWSGDSSQFLVTGKMWNKIFLIETSTDSHPPTTPYNITVFLDQDLYFR